MANNTSLPPLAERILYISDSCVVVNKLSGEAVEGAKQGQQNLPAALGALLAENKKSAEDFLCRPEAVHRLDVPVSGCVLFARTKSALAFLNAAFSSDATFSNDAAFSGSSPPLIEKRYWAITEIPSSTPPLSENGLATLSDAAVFKGELVHWLSFDSRLNKSFAHNKPGNGRKKAVLRCRLAGAGRNYLFFEIELLSGRHHQIRAQLAAVGLHIKGDLKYGAKRSEPNGGIRLHARSIRFPNPEGNITALNSGAVKGSDITVIAEPLLCDNLWLAFKQLPL